MVDSAAGTAPAADPPAADSSTSAWYLATPARMARVAVSAYRAHLIAYGLSAMRAELIAMRAEDVIRPRLDGLKEQPADQALRIALPVMAHAFAEAMDFYSVWQWAIDAIEDRVREEVEERIAEHLKLRAEREGQPSEPTAEPERPANDGAAETGSSGG